MKRLLFILLATVGMAFGQTTHTMDSTPTAAEFNALVADEVNVLAGDIIEIPAGDFTGGAAWTEAISLTSSRGLTVQGQGAGGVISYTETAFDVSSPPASKVFSIYPLFHTTPADSSSGAGSYVTEPEFTVGETLFFYFSAQGDTNIEAEVTAYSYPSLTVDVINVSQGLDGSGNPHTNEDRWHIVRPPATRIQPSVTLADNATWFSVNAPDTGRHVIKDIGFLYQTVSSTGNSHMIRVNGGAGDPTLIMNCSGESVSTGSLFYLATNKYVITGGNFYMGFQRVFSNSSTRRVMRGEVSGLGLDSTWAEPSTMGKDDLDGETHGYFENCIVSGYATSCFDAEGNSKSVLRYNTYINSQVAGGHGQDTGQEASLRHYEIYRNSILSRSDGNQGQRSFSIVDYVSPRGGTFTFSSNYVQPAEQAGTGSSKSEIKPEVKVVRDSRGTYGCWGNDNSPADNSSSDFPATPDGSTDRHPDGEGWPAPRQPGMGYVDGLFGVQLQNGYSGDPEPMWVWGNTGLASLDIGAGNHGSNECGALADSASAYLRFDRDDDDTWGIYENGEWIGEPVSLIERSVSGKPGYAPYTYPHPLSPAEIGSRPVIAISSPTHPATAALGASVTLSGTATDAEDGTISSSLAWRSSIDGAIGTGASVMTSTLSAGHHIIYATSTDTDDQFTVEAVALEIQESTTGDFPVVSITSPSDNSQHGDADMILFAADATDTEDGDIADDLTWTSNVDGAIGTGETFMLDTLSVGTHLITASVTDSDSNTSSDAITIEIVTLQLPTVTITAPAGGGRYREGKSLTFTATASDADDGDLTASIQWSSDLDGSIGEGGSVQTSTLSEGEHVITASVIDSDENFGEDAISLTIFVPVKLKVGTLRVGP